jgi:hypothetical protein
MTPSESDQGEPTLIGFLITVAVMVLIGLVLFLPLFLWLPVPSYWRLLTWVAALGGPVLGGELGARVAQRLEFPVRHRSLQQAAQGYVVLLFFVSVLPLIPDDRT